MQIDVKSSRNIFKNGIVIDCPIFFCRVFWAKVISSETQSLLTQYTKHTFFEMQYAINGEIGMLLGENEKIKVPQGYFVVVPPDTYHQITDGDSKGARFIIAFSLEPRDDVAGIAVKKLQTVKPYFFTENMQKLLSLLADRGFGDNALDKHMISEFVKLFVMEMMRTVNKGSSDELPENKTEPKNENLANHIVRYISERGGVGISADSVAKKFNYTTRHLNRTLQSQFGKTLKEVISHEKLKKIEELVVSTNLTLYEIAEICGFSDEYAMNKFFRRYNKVNMSEYKRIKAK